MSARTEKFSEQLKQLISQGELLEHAIEYDCKTEAFKRALNEAFDNDEEKVKKFIKKLPSFKKQYQQWYSEALAVVKQVLPDRTKDFVSYYEYSGTRKSIDFQNYMIRDYLQGLHITRGGGYEVVADGSAAIPEFSQQVSILKAALATVDSVLLDLNAVVQADLFDSEIDAAGALAKSGHLRAAGAICGVVIEKHLQSVCTIHSITVRKKYPGIADLSQLLRSAKIITLAQERFIQSLADTRNICSHAKGREPTKDELSDLVTGTGKVIKTVF